MENYDTFINFLDQISDLISSKALETKENERNLEVANQKALTLTTTKEKIGLSSIIGESKEIQILNQKIKRIASSISTVLITGESGTGKELYARALHNESERSEGPFIAVNCAAIPENLLESELFGYVRGAFTGADPKGKIGKFEQANNGTIFLDEIGDMPLYIQVKLLRVLEQREVARLGSNKLISINARVIAATNKNLEDMVKNNTFREDLYYRLNVIPLFLPPLRKRKSDIKLLANYFINKFSRLFNKKVVSISQSFWSFIVNYNWPGNVRELQNTIEYIINMMGEDGHICDDLLPPKIKNITELLKDDNCGIEHMEKELFKKAIEIYGSAGESKKVIAEKMGIGIATLYRKLKKKNRLL
ncbi:sigma-54 interaction domain-containing protein [Clostridium aciditolerans]|uniref:sigma-54 interaction domain-containing protein n=1 Tax=Clostridium aciditolerans TaxID=339861 RepID=UPI003CCCAD2F